MINSKFFLEKRGLFLIFFLFLFTIPTFWRMLRPGIFSMQDFPIFRLYEYDKCITDLQIPCRWAPDAGYEYGEPVFNFYAQLPFAFGGVLRFFGLSVLDSIKTLFIISLVFSAFSMFLLSKQLWKDDFAALTSSLIYIYAPYRAVDIYVRGALAEAFAFVFFPLVLYFFNDYVFKKRFQSLTFFGLFLALLILTHNLSAMMFLPILSLWAIFFLTQTKSWKFLPRLLLSAFFALGLAAFYLLPVYFESNLISIEKTVQGYFDYHAHFVTLKQLLISRYWGYGASLFGEDDRLSLSVGQVQWILPVVTLFLMIFSRKLKKLSQFLVFFALGWLALFLTHNKSVSIWQFPPMSYIQFPWRFLGLAVFSFALSCGALFTLKPKTSLKVIILSIVAASLIALNTPFFFEDLWNNFTDTDQFSKAAYTLQTSSSINDFWPKTAKMTPVTSAPKDPIIEGSGSGKLIEKRSNRAEYKLYIKSEIATVQLPIVYFPGWTVYNPNKIDIFPSGDLGLITFKMSKGDHDVRLKFENTQVRNIGNAISLISLLALISLLIYAKYRDRI